MQNRESIPVFVTGFPRIGRNRELKTLVEGYFGGKISAEELTARAREMELARLQELEDLGLERVPVGDFSLYDTTLDFAFALGMIPGEVRESGLGPVGQYFAMARGYQQDGTDIRALAMKKWFTTNYHYVVPVFTRDMVLGDPGPFFAEKITRARTRAIDGEPVCVGPLTLFVLTECADGDRGVFMDRLLDSYARMLETLADAGVRALHFDESVLVSDAAAAYRGRFTVFYRHLSGLRNRPEIHLHASFGDLSPLWDEVADLPIDGIGFDFVEGPRNIELIEAHPPKARTLHAGLVNGKNVWRTDYRRVFDTWERLGRACGSDHEFTVSASSSLLYVPYSVGGEYRIPAALEETLAFADEKLGELRELAGLLSLNRDEAEQSAAFAMNREVISRAARLAAIDPPGPEYEGWKPGEAMFSRSVPRDERLRLQHERFGLPLLPLTTIGSFPQTRELRAIRARFTRAAVSTRDYEAYLERKIDELVERQEAIGLDVLVHGEFERTDMVEFFAQHLTGFAFTDNGWVQSYGVRAVKPPIIFGDIARRHPISVRWIAYAQSRTRKPLKGMLTGPITIYNWSFPSEHLPFRKVINELALALRREILDLETAGIGIIQLDEAALRERLPLRDGGARDAYLDTAVRGFRLAVSGVRPETQIHTHMCYSDFGTIFASIIDLDADVITIEAAKSDLSILRTIAEAGYPGAIGPGVYDIHSPRVPPAAEIEGRIRAMLEHIDPALLWVNPDCGLKTRSDEEAWASLEAMVEAARAVRESLSRDGKRAGISEHRAARVR